MRLPLDRIIVLVYQAMQRRTSPRKRLRQMSLNEAFSSSSKQQKKVPIEIVRTKIKNKAASSPLTTSLVPSASVAAAASSTVRSKVEEGILDMDAGSKEKQLAEQSIKMKKNISPKKGNEGQQDSGLTAVEIRETVAEAAIKRATATEYNLQQRTDTSASRASSSSTVELDGSQPLFSDSDVDEMKISEANKQGEPELETVASSSRKAGDEIPTKSTVLSPSKEPSFKGPPISEFTNPPSPPLSPLNPTKYHTVFVKANQVSSYMTTPPDPFPPPQDRVEYLWDRDHVRFPCAEEAVFPVGKDQLEKKWNLIQRALTGTEFKSASDIADAIKSYKQKKGWWSFAGLSDYVESLEDAEKDILLKETVPGIAKLALRLPELFTQNVPCLKSGYNHSLTFSQEQVACILANAFFCTWPSRGAGKAEYPEINFNGIFCRNRDGFSKLSCVFHYFGRILKQMPVGTITYQRQYIKGDKLPSWDDSSKKLCKLHVSQEGTIEDYGSGMLQMDFANCYIGGGVLGSGCVQEEIRFMICPELLASMLFTEKMGPHESVFITGAERFSYYCGYASSFEWTAPFTDETPRDEWGRRKTEVVAVDAIRLSSRINQYSTEAVKRELDKLFCGFHRFGVKPVHLSAVATGNWGCGVFGGDRELKSLIQIMAATESGRDLVYFTFDDWSFMESLAITHGMLSQKQLSVGDLFALLMQFDRKHVDRRHPRISVFDYIQSVFDSSKNTESSDSESDGTGVAPEA